MNKTVSINLGGRLFNVEEDAYDRLKKYLDDIKAYFLSLDDQGEVVSDIEARIAEQLTERLGKDKKTVVTAADIDALIQTMGTVEDITGESKKENIVKNFSNSREKRLYRDEDHAIIAGVCAGIAAYLDVDPVWIRLAFLISIFFGGFGFLIYIILWIATPAAKSPTEKMEMHGQKITLAGVEETLKVASSKMEKEAKNIFGRLIAFIRAAAQRIFFVFGKVINKIIRFIAVIIGFGFILGGIFSVAGIFVVGSLIALPWGAYYFDFPAREAIPHALTYGLVSSIALIAVIPLIFLIILGVSVIRRRISVSLVVALSLLVIWIASISATAVMSLSVVPAYQNYMEKLKQLPLISRDYTDKFEKINVRNVTKIKVLYGEEYKVTATAAEMSLNRMDIKVTDGMLNVQRKNNNLICLDCQNAYLPVELTVTAPTLKGIDITGANEVVIDGFKDEEFNANLYQDGKVNLTLNAQKANLDIWFTDNVTVSGTVPIFNVKLSGRGDELLQAFDLNTVTTSIDMSEGYSGMVAQVSVEKSLDVVSRGRGRVIYKGSPTITEDFDKETLEDLRFEYEGEEYPVNVKKVMSDGSEVYEIFVDREEMEMREIPMNQVVDVNIGDKNYTARLRLVDDNGKMEVYRIGEAEVMPNSIVEAFKP